MARVAATLAGSLGVALPEDLRLWALAGRPPPPAAAAGRDGRRGGDAGETVAVEADDVDDVAAALEAATDPGARRANGLHVTPRWAADHLVGLALDPDGPPPAAVCDPACGGGAFLVAAARALHARGVPRDEIVCERLWGADIDEVGLAAAEAALALWSGGAVPPPGRLVVGDPLRRGPAVWPELPPGGVDLVVGNPPFQNQLGRATARAADDRRRLRERFGAALRPYTDTAWLFLLLGCELARVGGRVALVQPDSLVAARDAAAVRDAVDQAAELLDLWVDERPVFAAAVRVCAPVLRVDRPPPLPAPGPGPADDGSAGDGPAGDGARPDGRRQVWSRWHDLLADGIGVPRADLDTAGGRLGDRADAAAGFRDEYYGLAALTSEAGPAGPGPGEVPLVTAGVIDWGRSAWGERPTRFAKRSWAAPVVDLARLEAEGAPAVRRWRARTDRPKILVATQTRVVEPVVDEGGGWIPSVPVIAVVPHDPADLWPLAAALAAPAATAWLLRRAPGAALSRRALKIAGPDLAGLPLPTDAAAWAAATAAFRALVAAPVGSAPEVPGASEAAPGPVPEAAEASGASGGPGAADAFEAFVAAAAAAYGSPDTLVSWWRDRLGATTPGARSSVPTGPVGHGAG